MLDTPSPAHNDIRSSSSNSATGSNGSSPVRNGSSQKDKEKKKESSGGDSKSKPRSSSPASSADSSVNTVQVANIAPQVTSDQLLSIFGYVGKIVDIRLFPTFDTGAHLESKICFVKFRESRSVASAQHLTNTVFIDRALIVTPYLDGNNGEIPDESKAMELLAGGGFAGIVEPKLPQHVSSQLEGYPVPLVMTTDPHLAQNNLPPYPPLPSPLDSRRLEEIRRTLLVCNIDPEMTAQEVMDCFSKAGEVKYFRFCTRDNDPLRYALIEFTEQPSILAALQLNGQCVNNNVIRVYHATQAIIKPQAKTNEAAQKEIEDAMTRQVENVLSHGLDMDTTPPSKKKKSSRSHRHRSRSRSRSSSGSRRRSHRRRSSSRDRDRYRGSRVRRSPGDPESKRSKKRRSRSRSGGRKSKKRSRSRSNSHSRSKETKRSRSRSTERRREKKKSKKEKKDKDRDREKSR